MFVENVLILLVRMAMILQSNLVAPLRDFSLKPMDFLVDKFVANVLPNLVQ